MYIVNVYSQFPSTFMPQYLPLNINTNNNNNNINLNVYTHTQEQRKNLPRSGNNGEIYSAIASVRHTTIDPDKYACSYLLAVHFHLFNLAINDVLCGIFAHTCRASTVIMVHHHHQLKMTPSGYLHRMPTTFIGSCLLRNTER